MIGFLLCFSHIGRLPAYGLCQAFDYYEFFAGVGNLSRFAQACGYRAVRFDIKDHDASKTDRRTNYMDLNSCSGFAFLVFKHHN